jgi:phosphoglycolate phosphatase
MNAHSAPWILWDWNGTLVDDFETCFQINHSMRLHYQLPPLGVDGYRDSFGFPLEDFYLRTGFDLIQPSYAQLTQDFMSAYYHPQVQHQLFDDVIPILESLQNAGYKHAILSASRQERLEAMVQDMGIAHFFERICGVSNDAARSKYDSLKDLIASEALDPHKTWIIGDTHHDLEIAQKAGFRALLIPRGHQSILQATQSLQTLKFAPQAPVLPGFYGICPDIQSVPNWVHMDSHSGPSPSTSETTRISPLEGSQ